MRAVIQRITSASVSVRGEEVSSIGPGLLALVGVSPRDTDADAKWLAQKIVHLRLFSDEKGKTNLSLLDCKGALLMVSQFTVYADARRGKRPSFGGAASPEVAEPLYEKCKSYAEDSLGSPVASGLFKECMSVSLVNDGPFTIIVDSHASLGE